MINEDGLRALLGCAVALERSCSAAGQDDAATVVRRSVLRPLGVVVGDPGQDAVSTVDDVAELAWQLAGEATRLRCEPGSKTGLDYP